MIISPFVSLSPLSPSLSLSISLSLFQVSPYHSIYILLVCRIGFDGSGTLVWLHQLHRPRNNVLVLWPASLRLQVAVKASKIYHNFATVSDVCWDICKWCCVSSHAAWADLHILLGHLLSGSSHVRLLCNTLHEFLLSEIYSYEAKKDEKRMNVHVNFYVDKLFFLLFYYYYYINITIVEYTTREIRLYG